MIAVSWLLLITFRMHCNWVRPWLLILCSERTYRVSLRQPNWSWRGRMTRSWSWNQSKEHSVCECVLLILCHSLPVWVTYINFWSTCANKTWLLPPLLSAWKPLHPPPPPPPPPSPTPPHVTQDHTHSPMVALIYKLDQSQLREELRYETVIPKLWVNHCRLNMAEMGIKLLGVTKIDEV